ncbi:MULTISPECIES: PfkB family carbohydrate kinase [unclassified Chelatococcus]|uniref:PfkB family carbohydrate kinase n=1 Tax=unclassified Chelatococcus TaxID=2638111 RepID=UPI001BD14AAB|nr:MULTISPECIES: PfkB family carbohydrate kinase [unclassified Chelatococcus]MBS7695946.1 sugar kinase [Chelatococcus sp. YT9]MBX3555679.1 sugar kinase [Chelatococcus sp.]
MHQPTSADLTALAPQTRIICLGHCALDQTWQVDSLLTRGNQKMPAQGYHVVGGGMAATAAVAVARLGGKAAFWGRAGQDLAGEAMKRELVAEGVDASSLRLIDGALSSLSAIIIDAAGERQLVNFRGDLPDDADWLPLHEIASASAVLVDPRWPAGALALFQAARRAGVPTVLDGDVTETDAFQHLLPLTDHAIFSENGLAQFTGLDVEKGLARAATYGCRITAVTRGEAGVTWLEEGRLHHLPAFPVVAVNTNGAGDTFHGAYALAIGAGLGSRPAFSFAAAAAALKCTRPGTRAGIPGLSECLAFEAARSS